MQADAVRARPRSIGRVLLVRPVARPGPAAPGLRPCSAALVIDVPAPLRPVVHELTAGPSDGPGMRSPSYPERTRLSISAPVTGRFDGLDPATCPSGTDQRRLGAAPSRPPAPTPAPAPARGDRRGLLRVLPGRVSAPARRDPHRRRDRTARPGPTREQPYRRRGPPPAGPAQVRHAHAEPRVPRRPRPAARLPPDSAHPGRTAAARTAGSPRGARPQRLEPGAQRGTVRAGRHDERHLRPHVLEDALPGRRRSAS